MRLCVACPAARAGVSSGGTGAPTGSQRPLSPPRLLQALLRDPQEHTICQATLWASRGNTFSLVSQHMFLFFLTSQTTREGAGSRKRPRFGTLLESLAGKDGRNRRDRVPWNAAFHSHHRRETGCIRGCGAGTQASSFSHSPTRSTHTYMLRSRTPSSPPESPQPHAGEPGESSVRSARGPGMETQPVQAGPFGLLKACLGGGQLPMPAGAPWYPGPLHNNTAGSSGQEKEVPLQASDSSQGNGGKTSEGANGADLEEASETSEGRPCLQRRTSGFLGADRGEGRHSHPPGQRLFSGTKGSQGLTGRREEHFVTDPPPAPAPQAASSSLFPQEGRSCPFIHTGGKKPESTLLHMLRIKLRSTPGSRGWGPRWPPLPRLRGPAPHPLRDGLSASRKCGRQKGSKY